MITEKEVSISTVDNGYIVECSWSDGNTYAHDKQFAKNLPKVKKIIAEFFNPKDKNVIPF